MPGSLSASREGSILDVFVIFPGSRHAVLRKIRAGNDLETIRRALQVPCCDVYLSYEHQRNVLEHPSPPITLPNWLTPRVPAEAAPATVHPASET